MASNSRSSEEAIAAREAERQLVLDHTVGGRGEYDAGEVHTSPEGIKYIGDRRDKWERMAATSRRSLDVRSDGDHDVFGDPGSIEEENQQLGTPDAVTVAKLDRVAPTLPQGWPNHNRPA